MISAQKNQNKPQSVFDCVFFLSSPTTVPFSCPIMEVTWTWSPPWQSKEMNWRGFRRTEGKIKITSVSVSSFIFTVAEHQKQTTTRTQRAEAKGVLPLCTTVKNLSTLRYLYEVLVVRSLHFKSCSWAFARAAQIGPGTAEQVDNMHHFTGFDCPGVDCLCCCVQISCH